MDESASPPPQDNLFIKKSKSDSRGRSYEIAPQWVLIFGSIAVITISQFIRSGVPHEYTLVPLILLPINLILFFFGIRAIDRGYLPHWLDQTFRAAANWLQVTSVQVVSLMFSLFFCILTPVAAGFAGKMVVPWAAVLCWVLGILLAVYGSLTFPIQRQPISRLAIAAGALLFTTTLVIRAINTASIPAVLTGDEGSSGLFSLGFLNGSVNNIFTAGWFSFPIFHNFLQSISILILGQTTQALRLLSAFAGALTVALVFFIGRSMFGWRSGLMAAVFLAGMHFHIHFSRIGLNNIWDGFFITLTLGCVWMGWQQNKRAAFLLAGVALGLAQYFYVTGRILFLIIPLFLAAAGLTNRSRLRQVVPSLLFMFWIALIVTLPLDWFYIKHPDEFMAPMNRVTIMGDWIKNTALETGCPPVLIFLDQLWKGFLGYFGLPLRAWYMPGVPLLRTFPSVAFLLGLVFMLLRPKDSRNQLIFIWLAVLAAAAGMSESTPAAQRYVAAAPAAALLVAYSLFSLGNLLVKRWPGRKKWIGVGILVFCLLISIDDARFYFYKYTPRSDFGGFNGRVAQTLALRLKDEPAGQEVVFCGYPNMGYHSISSLPYLAPQIQYYDVNSPWGSANDPQPTGERVLFVFLPDHENDQAAVENEYTGGTWSEFYSDDGTLLFRLYDFQRQ